MYDVYLGVQAAADTNLTVSHSSLIRLLERAGKNFDEEVLKWKDGIASTLDTSNEIVSFKFLVVICKIPSSKPR